ncbi:Hsp20/alpha crystallin family protein [Neobacillus sp. OS1-2]|uniref:Hsp20/alpha crystallin family protein n=1 Tax=Neobacillus sp. OS1-2 TaxID=3070680 RepID=UPI0027E1FBD2|nr:Hsp20/alpha crystallin family protein [Neobacillus sp. OS1-2]WML39838.1 Hsp20/alpha crystallin family protein [Neobacillus sp. OS1-2]
MKKKRQPQHQTLNFDLVEKWLENFFLDPLTSYFDQTQFQIDLYETETEWIVEAILSEYEASEIKVFIEGKKLMISALRYPPSTEHQKKIRIIDFPFSVTTQEVSAAFSNGILEIFISKTEIGSGKNRFITLP